MIKPEGAFNQARLPEVYRRHSLETLESTACHFKRRTGTVIALSGVCVPLMLCIFMRPTQTKKTFYYLFKIKCLNTIISIWIGERNLIKAALI